jgi:hypothetical protein
MFIAPSVCSIGRFSCVKFQGGLRIKSPRVPLDDQPVFWLAITTVLYSENQGRGGNLPGAGKVPMFSLGMPNTWKSEEIYFSGKKIMYVYKIKLFHKCDVYLNNPWEVFLGF